MLRRAMVLVMFVSTTVLLMPGVGIAGGGCHNVAPATTGRADDNVVVDVAKCVFSPTILYVEPGTEVTWTNKDPVPHTITGTGLSLHGMKEIQRGESTPPFRFDEEGVYPYYCILHPGMVGAVVVGDVSDAKANAEEIQAQPIAVTRSNDEPPRPESSSVLPYALALVGAAALGSGAVMLWRRRARGPLATDEHSALHP